MKQYLNSEQTAKLIELGFMEPIGSWETSDNVYSIGELLEKLPLYRIEFDTEIWVDTPRGGFYATELIDALFEACVKLKKEGVI